MKQFEKNISTLVMIKSVYQSLSKTEQKVADFVLANADETMYSSVTVLAEKAAVGETSVLRFCRKLGFKGFQEFKLAVAQDLVNPVEEVEGHILQEDPIETISMKIASQTVKAINDTTSLLSMTAVAKAVEQMLTARRIYFYGIGHSGLIAAEAKYRFMHIGFSSDSATDGHSMLMAARLAAKEDVVVGISSSGSEEELLAALELARKNGARTIAVVSRAKSPVTQKADIVLLAAQNEVPFPGGAFTPSMGQLHILDLLSTAAAMKRRNNSR